MDFYKLNFIIQKFFINSKIIKIKMIKSGLINKTYIVEHLYNGNKSKFILQSLGDIFESQEIVNINHKLITDHITKKISKNYFLDKMWKVPNLVRCKSNNLFSFQYKSEFWRAMVFIEDTLCFDFLEDEMMAYQTGIGLAKFHLICSDLDSSKLTNTIKNFHNTKYYIDQYIKTLKDYDFTQLDNSENKRIRNLVYYLSNHIRYVELLLTSIRNESLDYNVIHGDPKLSNFLFDVKDKYVASIIDLDTVCLGYLLTDLADCIRSICNVVGVDSKNKAAVSFDVKYFKYFLNGYFSINSHENNYSYVFILEFIYLIIFELTIRFLTDFLQSNKYFNVKYKTHNLYRAEVQSMLLSSFLTQIPLLSNELHEIGVSASSNFVSDAQKFV